MICQLEFSGYAYIARAYRDKDKTFYSLKNVYSYA